MPQGKFRSPAGHVGREDLLHKAPMGQVRSGRTSVYELPDGVPFDLTLFRDGTLAPYRVTKFWLCKEPGGYKVTSNLHTSGQIGQNQGLFTLDNDLNPVYRQPEVGMIVGVWAADGEPSGGLEEITLPPAGDLVRCRFKERVPLTFEVGYFLGLVVSDGWGDETGKVCWAKTSPGVNAKMCEIVNTLSCSDDVRIREQDNPHDFDGHESFSTKRSFASKQWAPWIRKHIGTGALNKRLPDFWSGSPTSFRRGLLSGLIDGDGTVSTGRPRSKRGNKKPSQTHLHYATSSPGLARDVFLLARSLGLHATITTSPPRGNSKEAFTLPFNEASKQAMRPWLQLYNEPNLKAFDEYEPSHERQKGYYAPPLTYERLRELGKLCWTQSRASAEGWSPEKVLMRRRLYNAVAEARSKAPGLLRDAAREIIEAVPEAFDEGFWCRWRELVLDDRLRWEVLEEVEVIEDEAVGFDLDLGPGQALITDEGFIVGAETNEAAETNEDVVTMPKAA